MKKILYKIFERNHLKGALHHLKSLEKVLLSPQARFSIPFAFKGKGFFKSMRCMQNPDEIERLYEFVCTLKPKRVLEIGTAKGGALYLWLQAADAEATVVSVDLPDGEFGGGYPTCRIPFYQAFTKPSQRLHLVRADSHQPETLATVRHLFQGEPIDFLVIDGDHTYEGVKHDFLAYAPLVAKGGWIALHDILPRPDLPSIQVDRFWKEIEGRYETRTVIGREGSGRLIGWGLVKIT